MYICIYVYMYNSSKQKHNDKSLRLNFWEAPRGPGNSTPRN